LIPCKGMYADVVKKMDFKQVDQLEMFKSNLASYNAYKDGFSSEKTITEDILGKYSECRKNIYFVIFLILGYKRKTKLHLVRIFFATPTFDRITKDEKANFETKLSTVGGTMGLLTGFSIISGVEVIYFCIKIAVKIVKDLLLKKQEENTDLEIP
jgi:hypothetical protein